MSKTNIYAVLGAAILILAGLAGCGVENAQVTTQGSARLAAIDITPHNISIAVNTGLQLTATGIYSDNTTRDLTASVVWSSSNTSVATVDTGATGIAGHANGKISGTVTIKATSGKISGSITITVTPAALISLAITPTNASLAPGTAQQFTATGSFSDGSTQNLTTTAAWNSSSVGVATISNAAGSKGLATPAAAGSTTITATSGGISGSATLTVTAATLVSIAVTPANVNIAPGTTQQFTATGTFSNGSTQNLTSTAIWSSSSTSVATISNTGGSKGLATAAAAGSTTITATSGTISGSKTLTVTAATLTSISVTPSGLSLLNGATQQLTATGTYSNNKTQDLTASVIWSSSNTVVATISNAAGSKGLVTAIAAGTTTITSTSGNVSGTTTVTVTTNDVPPSGGPRILYTDILSGPNSGGENNNGTYLTIFGKGFGTSRGTSIVTINGIEVAAYIQWGANSIVYPSHGIQMITVQPGSAVTTGAIVVTVGGIASNSDKTFTVRSGRIWFVATTGNDSTCAVNAIASPCQTVAGTLQKQSGSNPLFLSGDTVVMRGGTYTVGGGYMAYLQDSNSDPFTNATIMGYPGESVIVRKPFTTYSSGGNNSNATFSNIKCQLSASSVQQCFNFTYASTNDRIVNSEGTGNTGTGSGTGVIEWDGTGAKMLGNYVHDNGGSKLYHAMYQNDNEGIHPSSAEIGWNHIANQGGGRGIQIYHSGGVISNTIVHDNVIHDIALDGVVFGESSTTGMVAYNNIIYATGVKARQTDGSDGGCIRIDSSSVSLSAYNNTLYDCGTDLNSASGALRLDQGSSFTFKNNIVFALGTEQYVSQSIANGAITSANNVWYRSSALSPPSWASGQLNSNPLLVSPTTDFSLQAGSPAINAGTAAPYTKDFDGVTRPQGSAWDIGAYEYVF